MSRRPKEGTTQPRLFAADPFEGFGPSLFRIPDEPVVGCYLRSGRPSRLHHGVRDHAPRLPGVYGMLDNKGKLIYIGKAKNLRSRLLSYFRVNSRDPKAGRILKHTRALVWEQAADEFAALLRELELIQRFRPRFNVLGLPGLQRHHYVCLGKPPAPYAYITKVPTGKETGCYGPLVARPRSEDAVRRLNDWFKLRDCPQTVPMLFADQGELFPDDRGAKCLRFEIETCSGPCVGACSRKEYGDRVRAMKAFLDGRDRTVLASLKSSMEEASAGLEYEKATAMRDRLQAFQWLDDRLSLLRKARTRNSFVYPLAGSSEKGRWYLIHGGLVRGVLQAPESDEDCKQAAKTILATFTNAPPSTLTERTVDSVLLVAAWFRKCPAEKAKLLTKAQALTRCGCQSQQGT